MEQFRETCIKLATKGQLAFLHEELTAMNDVLLHQQARINKILKWHSDQYMNSLPDREKWAQFRDRLTYLLWQSVCTTVLSRKVKIEEDVDDGSFTTIERLQLVNSVFKRAKITEQEEQEDMVKSWQNMFKHRIHDLNEFFNITLLQKLVMQTLWTMQNGGNSFVSANFRRIEKQCHLCELI